jgi:hypothetical protein
MNANAPSFLLVLLTAASVAIGADQGVSFNKDSSQIEVLIGDKSFAVYNTSSDLPKPFFSPVRGSDGTILSRSLENPEDHKHHKGIWISVDEVNDVKFWAEAGKIQNIAIKTTDARGDAPAKLHTVNHWLGEDGKPIVVEDTTISIFPNRLMAYDINFTAGKKEVTFGDTKEGLFGFRMVNSMREKESGKVVNADGKRGTDECWGIPSAWVDYYGEVEGKVFGVTLMDHPGNLRPSRYHVRNYGLFSISPFGEKAYTRGKNEAALVVLKPGESLKLRYAIYIHDGDTAAGKVAEAYKQFLGTTR